MIKTIAQSVLVGFVTWLIFRAWFAFREGAKAPDAVKGSINAAVETTAAATNILTDPNKFAEAKQLVSEFIPTVKPADYFTTDFANKFFEVAKQIYAVALEEKEKPIANKG